VPSARADGSNRVLAHTMTTHFLSSPKRRPTLLPLIVTLGCALFQASCHRISAARADSPAASSPLVIDVSARSLALTTDQLHAIRIEPVQKGEFAFELEAVGSVSLEEDPAIVQAESSLLTAAANWDASRRELKRVESLGESNGIAPKEAEGALAAEQSAAAALTAARETVRALGISDRRIDHLIKTARFDASNATSLRKWVLVDLPEIDSPNVHGGQAVRVAVPAFPGHWYLGSISRVYATIDPSTHRVTARAQVSDPKNQLRPGMLATVVLFADPIKATAIPTSAAVREGDGSMIAWVTADRRHFDVRTVKLGRQSQGRYQVLEGLQVGELVVTEGGVFLSNLLASPPSD
jgi:membrane fusion protein, heavy metal efflux system